jgi:hypothetical protein
MARYSDEFVQAQRARFPELYDAVMAAETPAKLGAVVRRVRAGMDAGTLAYAACEGALVTFKTVRSEDFAAGRAGNASAAEMRADRILHTGARDAAGRRVARRWGGGR